tara:strand:+ start:873 stop:1142 length:270 start_codon:yes stop_codon:yes gene_type:complete
MAIFNVAVTVRLQTEVNDPQGLTIQSALSALGFSGISNVRAGKLIEFQIEAASEDVAAKTVEQLSDNLLSNPVIENFEYAISTPTSNTR